MTWEVIVLQTVSGLSEGMIVFLCAMGLTLILGSLRVLNVSHGSIYMIGSYFVVAGNTVMLAMPGHFYFAIILATIGAAIVGGIIEILVIRPIYKLAHIYQFITTFAVTFIVMDLVKIIWGGSYHTINYPTYLQGPIMFSGFILPKYNMALIVFGIAVFISMYFFINKSRLGLIVRGITVDRMMMSLFGFDVPRIYTFVFMLGCALAGLGGSVVAPISAAGPGIDIMVLIKSFIVIVVGGFGSIGGALLAAMVIGLVNAFGILFIPKVALGFAYFIMVITLIVRPWGLLGKPIKMA
jgi:branched-subunit amino acid ABC-type transport system permease component